MAKQPRKLEVPGESAAPQLEGTANADIEVDENDGLDPPVIEYVQEPIIDSTPKGLPNASEVDPGKIQSMTLTKQGWVVPDSATARGNN